MWVKSCRVSLPVCFAMTELNHGSNVSQGNWVFQQMIGKKQWRFLGVWGMIQGQGSLGQLKHNAVSNTRGSMQVTLRPSGGSVALL